MLNKRVGFYITGLLLFLCLTLPAFGQEEVTITFVGDVQPHVLERASAKQRDYIRQQFNGSDFVFCNLETPLTTSSRLTSGKSTAMINAKKDFAFKAHPSTVKWLRHLGFSVVCLANNHMMDYTETGLMDTIDALAKSGIAWCGAGKNKSAAEAPVILQSKSSGVKIGFISYSEIAPLMSDATVNAPGIAFIRYPPGSEDLNKISKSIKAARAKGADIVIVTLHWGKEKSTQSESYQKEFAKRLMQNGADCIIGHHPHVLRTIEKINGKTIAYSLGNFVFDSDDRKTLLLTVKFTRNGSGEWIQNVKTKPMYIENGIPVKF